MATRLPMLAKMIGKRNPCLPGANDEDIILLERHGLCRFSDIEISLTTNPRASSSSLERKPQTSLRGAQGAAEFELNERPIAQFFPLKSSGESDAQPD